MFGYTIIRSRELSELRQLLSESLDQRARYRKLWQESQERLHKTMGGPQRQVSQPKPDTVREISQRAGAVAMQQDRERLQQRTAEVNQDHGLFQASHGALASDVGDLLPRAVVSGGGGDYAGAGATGSWGASPCTSEPSSSCGSCDSGSSDSGSCGGGGD